jgi:hypothetical protein
MSGSNGADPAPRSSRQPRCGAPLITHQHLRRILENLVAPTFAVAPAALWTRTRGSRRAALARQVAMYLAHVGMGLSLSEVGRLFARDRSTVTHACGVVEVWRDCAPFDRALDLLEAAMRLVSLHRA